jgi:hypothetical protein
MKCSYQYCHGQGNTVLDIKKFNSDKDAIASYEHYHRDCMWRQQREEKEEAKNAERNAVAVE